MFDRLRSRLLQLLKVPPEPEPPFGDPRSTRVFRAGKNYFKLRLLGWAAGQAVVLVGIFIGIGVVATVEYQATEIRAAERSAAVNHETPSSANTPKSRPSRRQPQSPLDAIVGAAAKLPPGAFALLWALKALGLAIFAGQAVVSYFVLRLDYEMRWYIVTDRSLRIRTGLWRVQEMTMSFANLQQVEVSQGPLQRLLGIADVRVKSAGGGGDQLPQHGGKVDSMHTGFFHGVENATEVRDLILSRLRLFRETGLGDPDELHATPGLPVFDLAPHHAPPSEDVLAAAREVLTEVRHLRTTLRC